MSSTLKVNEISCSSTKTTFVGISGDLVGLDLSDSTLSFALPNGTTDQRPQSDENGLVEGAARFNTTTNKPEYYDGVFWKNFDGTGNARMIIGSPSDFRVLVLTLPELTFDLVGLGTDGTIAQLHSDVNNNIIVIKSNGQVWRSLDSGNIWSQLSGISTSIQASRTANSKTNQIVVAGSAGLRSCFYSSNGGVSWASTSMPYTSTGSINSPTYFSSGNFWILPGQENGNTDPVVFRSTNGGQNWTKVFTSATDGEAVGTAVSLTSGRLVLSVDKTGNDFGNAIYSTNNGTSWSTSSDLTVGYGNFSDLASNGSLIVATVNSYGILYKSSDGENWERILTDFTIPPSISSITYSDIIEKFVVVTGSSIIFGDRNAINWQQVEINYDFGTLNCDPLIVEI